MQKILTKKEVLGTLSFLLYAENMLFSKYLPTTAVLASNFVIILIFLIGAYFLTRRGDD